MELIACMVGGLALIACGIGLSRLRPPDWQADGELLDMHRVAISRWSAVQRIVRLLNNWLLATIGVAIIATAFVPRGRAWMLIWIAILLLLLICILFAMLDAFSSLSGYRRALPEAARRSFTQTEKQDPAPHEESE